MLWNITRNKYQSRALNINWPLPVIRFIVRFEGRPWGLILANLKELVRCLRVGGEALLKRLRINCQTICLRSEIECDKETVNPTDSLDPSNLHSTFLKPRPSSPAIKMRLIEIPQQPQFEGASWLRQNNKYSNFRKTWWYWYLCTAP